MACALLLALMIVALPGVCAAEDEGLACPVEPADMPIAYGDVVVCSLDSGTDADIYRFAGVTDEQIVLLTTHQSGSMRPCVELTAPAGGKTTACLNSFTNRIDARLAETGEYAARVYSRFAGTGVYTLTLERLLAPSADVRAITYGQTLTDEINPAGDLDLFSFDGVAGETILLQMVYNSGSLRPCVEMIAPNNNRTKACQNAFTNRIDTTLTQTGRYTVLADVFFLGSGGYAMTLERLAPPSENATTIQCGQSLAGEIAPEGDVDLFAFNAGRGAHVTGEIVYRSGSMRPCIEVIGPDNSRTRSCQMGFSNTVELTLSRRGVYAALADVWFTGAGAYSMTLQCAGGQSDRAFLPLLLKLP
jgi:hypothetical protein